MSKERTRKRSSYHNVKSYDDELELVRELLEAAEPYENAMNKEFEILLDKLVKLYEYNFPFYFKDGVNTKELRKLRDSLMNGKAPQTEISRAIDEMKRDIRTLQINLLTSWLIIDYEMTKEKTAQSLGLDPQSNIVMYFNNPEVRKEIISSSWCPDKKTYIDRVLANTRDMDIQLRKVILAGLQRGWSKERMSQILQNITGMAAYKADRLIRTETMAVWSKCTKEMFLEDGIEYVEIIGDAICGGICTDFVGEVISLKEAELGDDLPPYHPNCACSFCSYTEFSDEKNDAEDNFDEEDFDDF